MVFSVGEGVTGIGEETIKPKGIFELISLDDSLRVPGYVGQIMINRRTIDILMDTKTSITINHIRTQMNKVFVNVRKNLMKLIIISHLLLYLQFLLWQYFKPHL